MRTLAWILLVSLPLTAAAQTPDWAFPQADRNASQALLDAVAKDEDAARARSPELSTDSAAPGVVRTLCANCHLPSGLGQPQSAPLAGLPALYIGWQLADFPSGARTGYHAADMAQFARGLSAGQAKEVADYYASLKSRPWIKVVEAAIVPKTYVGERDIRARLPQGGSEALGQRIIELADDPGKPFRADGPAYIAYVPVGSIAKGRELVTIGAGKTAPCDTCHGDALLGLGDAPPIAGRSPTYIARQLYQYRTGDRGRLRRGGNGFAFMRSVAFRLQADDIIAIAAYLATRSPSP